jgi:hypothetical protein
MSSITQHCILPANLLKHLTFVAMVSDLVTDDCIVENSKSMMSAHAALQLQATSSNPESLIIGV